MISTHRIAALIKSKITNTYWPYYQPIFLLLVFDLASKIEFIELLSNLDSQLWQNITFLLYFLNAVGMEEMGIFYVINLRIFCFFVLSRRKEYTFTKKFAQNSTMGSAVENCQIQESSTICFHNLKHSIFMYYVHINCVFCNHSIFPDSVSFDSCNAIVPILHLT